MEIKITTSNGVKLNTKGKYCADDINIVVDIPSDSGSGGEPTLEQYLKGELTEYSNSNITPRSPDPSLYPNPCRFRSAGGRGGCAGRGSR